MKHHLTYIPLLMPLACGLAVTPSARASQVTVYSLSGAATSGYTLGSSSDQIIEQS